jgi:hypothetical protein
VADFFPGPGIPLLMRASTVGSMPFSYSIFSTISSSVLKARSLLRAMQSSQKLFPLVIGEVCHDEGRRVHLQASFAGAPKCAN